MATPLILSLSHCTDPRLVGGKAAGLARLLASGFPVPPGLCVTTEAYERTLQTIGFHAAIEWQRICALPDPEREAALAECHLRIRAADVAMLAGQWMTELQAISPSTSWAVRSSATNEDTAQHSFAGVYRTHLAVAVQDIHLAVKDLWASVWQAAVVTHLLQRGRTESPPAMAVLIQPMLDARTAGVAYSIHPVTGRSTQVAINAVFGLAAPLVDGKTLPDQYVVEVSEAGKPVRIRRRTIAEKIERLTMVSGQLCKDSIPEAAHHASSLSDEELVSLTGVIKDIEKAFGHPVDVEWVFDAQQLWIVQARPVTTVRPVSHLTNDDCEWSRANFKETMPEVPSPMGLSFLESFMDRYILSHYRRLGCRIPEGVSAVRVLHGRPYLNVTLFYSLVSQLGGEPSLNVEHMGGEPLQVTPVVRRLGRLASLRAGWLILKEMRRGAQCGPAWFAEMKEQAAAVRADRLQALTSDELVGRLDALGRWLDGHEVTFGIVAGVGQCLQILSRLLPRWLGADWRTLLNAALQGQGTVISAQQIMRLVQLAEAARSEPAVVQWFDSNPWNPSDYRRRLAGTAFLRLVERFLEDYGHRAVGESDVMSPRMAEEPEAILAVLRIQVRASSASTASDILNRQEQCHRKALMEIRRRVGWRLDRWILFQWWYRRLTRLFALREANRHHLMYYSAAVRHVMLQLGERLVMDGHFGQADDIFFVTLDEQRDLLRPDSRDWKALVARRRDEWAAHAKIPVPDTIRDWDEAVVGMVPMDRGHDGLLHGLPISVGCVTGLVRLVRSSRDWGKVAPGDIVVAPVIDPGMAPLFGIAGGLIVEMGGTLSHGAIMAREYGLPTVANVERAMTRLREGCLVTLDAGAGSVRLAPHR
jgi:rifampicin phosphotransferase